MSEQEVLVEEKTKASKPRLFDGFLKKLKKIKHLDIILTVLFIAIILLIYFSTFKNTPSKNDNENISDSISSSFLTYQNNLEEKLEKIISSIQGAGKVSVMLYFEKGIESIIAYNIEKETLANGTISETKSPVLITINGKTDVIILQKIMPPPSSILIVATGASKTNVKLEILRAVQAMFELSTLNIEIFAGN